MHKQLLLIFLFFNISIFTMQKQQLDQKEQEDQGQQFTHLNIAYLQTEPEKPHLKFAKRFSRLDPRLVDMCLSQAPAPIKSLVGELNTHHNFPQPVHTLLVGEEGIGKKTLAYAIAQKTHSNCIKINLGKCHKDNIETKRNYLYALHHLLLSTIKPLFETQKQTIVILDKLEYARNNPHIVYGPIQSDETEQQAVIIDDTEKLDCFEDIKPQAVVTPAEVVVDLLSHFKKYNKKNIIFIGTALAPECIESTIYQQFDPVTIDLPTYEARKQSLLYQFTLLRELPIQVELDPQQLETLAARTQGFTHSDINAIRKIFSLNLLYKPLKKDTKKLITYEEIKKELEEIQKKVQPCYIRTSNYAKDHWQQITALGSALGAGTATLMSFLRKK